MIERTINYFHSYAAFNKPGKLFHVIVNGVLFLIITVLFAIVPLKIEQDKYYFQLLAYPLNYYISVPLVAFGVLVVIWTNYIFLKNRGTPVPVNPPKDIIEAGPYKYSRHPMTWAVCIILLGFGVFYNSVLLAAVFTPLYTFINYYELKYIEEPELERRFGKKYLIYKNKVPMIF